MTKLNQKNKPYDFIKKQEGFVLSVDVRNGTFKALMLNEGDHVFPPIEKAEEFFSSFLDYDEIRLLTERAVFKYVSYIKVIDGKEIEVNYTFKFVTKRNALLRSKLKVFEKYLEDYYGVERKLTPAETAEITRQKIEKLFPAIS